MSDHLIVFILLALLAEILGTVGGFGSSLLFVPLAGVYFDFHSVLGITAVFHVFSNLSKIALFRSGINKKIIIQIGIPAIIFVALGAFLSNSINSNILELILGVFLILFSLLLIIFKKFKVKSSFKNSILSGILSGFTAGLLGTGGAIRGLFLSALNLNMEIFVATSAVIDLGVDITRSVVYGIHGYIHQHDLYLIGILFFVSFIGSYLGKLIMKKISQTQFKKIVLVLILLTGIYTVTSLIIKLY
ncbi:MAG: sulfite exporter TauE/SafE family protein [Sphingobacteriaceae bacterium]|nr:sulfite exporter TauE/SafE family protein [Sphingobacteriaceae bacterium]